MIGRLIEASIRNRFLVILITTALTVFGIYATLSTPIDAIPDLSENQVIVFTDWPGRSPREIEDQVTYPLSRKLQGLAGVKAVRSSSEFNFSMITIIFEQETDFYFARQRVSERLDQASTFLPPGVVPYLAPDATALGQIFWYTVETDKNGPLDPGRLWALNKFYIAQQLTSAAGVADVAVVGGMPLEYQIDVRPEKLRAYGITLGELFSSVSRGNMPAGGGVVQKNNAEYIVRGIGWIKGASDIENTVIKGIEGTPIYVKNVATVQLGTQFRRSVFEKNGSEVVGGVVLMRHGQNPLAVTQRVKAKIQDLQTGLPEGVHIVPAYDRTRLITGAIYTLGEVMWHEMAIATAAILLVLMHVRSVFIICVTLPLSVLFSFSMMWLLRVLGIVDIQANIMSLAGITISIGILVDQAIVMTENATHTLKRHFGDRKVTGDITNLVIPACRLVGRPIFFSVMIMLISFIPVFLLGGREGKLFQPLAFTKSFALLGVAILSVTLVPALIPTFLRGRIRSEEESWLVRSLIRIYKPVLAWALPRRNLVMWMFAALLILAIGLFPLQAVFGFGASETAWRTVFLGSLAVVTLFTVYFTYGLHWQAVSLVSLLLLGVVAFQFPKIGVSFIPALNEQTTLDMPVTVPRASITQVSDDIKARDALLRGFPEVESVIGKAGRADTPTDPAPLDMVESFINYRPVELWPKRVLRYSDAASMVKAIAADLEAEGFLVVESSEDRQNLINDGAQRALQRFDEAMRDVASVKYRDVENELESILVAFALDQIRDQVTATGQWNDADSQDQAHQWRKEFSPSLVEEFGYWLSRSPAKEDVSSLTRKVFRSLKDQELLKDSVKAQSVDQGVIGKAVALATEALTGQRPTFVDQIFERIQDQRDMVWQERVAAVRWQLFDFAAETFPILAIEETLRSAKSSGLVFDAPRRREAEALVKASIEAQLGRPAAGEAVAPFSELRSKYESQFRDEVFLWTRTPGPKGDLVDDEMGRVLQVPGWTNIFTQPIINRIEMLSTGVRTDIGVKVFGPNLATITKVCGQIESTLKPISGARDVVAAPIMGKGYVEVRIDREKAARYGIAVEDIQAEIEVALAGTPVTYTVEERNRLPVRIRYARTDRRDEESIRRLLVGPKDIPARGEPVADRSATANAMASAQSRSEPVDRGALHATSPSHAASAAPLVPLSAVADVRIVEGPAVIKSENGRLLNYVTLNVRGRDIVGFVDEAQRAVALNVVLPEGVHIEWSGEFEHQVRAAKTLRLVIPLVLILIFVILYWTYRDLADAGLMMMAVPEALAGGAFFLFFFPKFVHGWDAPPIDFSVTVWIGFIACFGMATETGIIMLVYLREAIEKRGGLENIRSLAELREAVIEGAAHRLRPKLLTEGVAILAIFPMVFAEGVGAEILAPMALPVLGGLLISDEVVDLFLPVRFYWVRRARWIKLHGKGE